MRTLAMHSFTPGLRSLPNRCELHPLSSPAVHPRCQQESAYPNPALRRHLVRARQRVSQPARLYTAAPVPALRSLLRLRMELHST